MMIVLDNLSKSFDGGATYAVRDAALEIARGELVALIGESGCGKTTTLKMINRLVAPTAGTVRMDGQDIAAMDPVQLRRNTGYIIQGSGLFPHYTVAQNVATVPRLLGWAKKDIAERVDAMLELVNLEPAIYRDRYPASLSGGQQQRVGVARGLAARPEVMLLDEAFGALDPITRAQLQDEFLAIHRRLELTTILVTHDMTEALIMADRIAVMKEGLILQAGPPAELLTHPADEYVRSLIEMPKTRADRIESLALPDGGAATP